MTTTTGRSASPADARRSATHVRTAPATTSAPPRLLTAAEVARSLHVSPSTVRRLIDAGQLEAVQVGRQWRIPEAAAAAYLRRSYSRPLTTRGGAA